MSILIGDEPWDDVNTGKAIIPPPALGDVARMLRHIAHMASHIRPADLVADEAQDALAEIAFSYGFTRLTTAARAIRLADIYAESDHP